MKLILALDVHEVDLDLRKLKIGLNKSKNLDHKWIPEEQRHIPLLTLNDITEEAVLSLTQTLVFFFKQESSFDVKLEGMGGYPSQDKARLLWVGVQNKKELRAIQEKLRDLLKEYLPINIEEVSLRPYLPVVRLRNYRQVSDLISPYKNSHFGKIRIDNAHLLEMTSGGAYPTYQLKEAISFNSLGS